MPDITHIVVEKGPDAGLKISVPPDGARLGRSARNDVTLNDPLLSRHHSRLFFKTGDGLWITDLGSANGTIVNGSEVLEQKLETGDAILLGDSVLRVLDNGLSLNAGAGSTAPAETQPAAAAAQVLNNLSAAPVVDLGFQQKDNPQPKTAPLQNRKFLYGLLAAVTVLAIAAWVYKLSNKPAARRPAASTGNELSQEDLSLDIEYEKVQATPQNIFRYNLRIKNNEQLIVKIDDLENDRHVRKEKVIDEDLLKNLASSLKDGGFFSLESRYTGIQPDVLDQWDLTVTIGRDTHRSVVLNRMPPESYSKVVELIENFGKNELGLWAIQFSSDKLTEMAQDSLEDGRKLYEARDVAYGNLADAIKKLEEAEWYMETVEPKPDFYREIITLLKDARTDRDSRYEDANFRAARAIKMREWSEAAKELGIIREMIPDRSDPRHKDASKSLMDVERRIKAGS